MIAADQAGSCWVRAECNTGCCNSGNTVLHGACSSFANYFKNDADTAINEVTSLKLMSMFTRLVPSLLRGPSAQAPLRSIIKVLGLPLCGEGHTVHTCLVTWQLLWSQDSAAFSRRVASAPYPSDR